MDHRLTRRSLATKSGTVAVVLITGLAGCSLPTGGSPLEITSSQLDTEGANPTIIASVENQSDDRASGTVGGELTINGEEAGTKYTQVTVQPEQEQVVNLIFNTVEIPESAEHGYDVWLE